MFEMTSRMHNSPQATGFSLRVRTQVHSRAALPRPQLSNRRKSLSHPYMVVRMSALSGIMEKAANANAELLARKEGSSLIGKKSGLQPLKGFPMSTLEDKADKVVTVLQQNGVICMRKALSEEMCDQLLAHVNEESERGKAEVETGKVEFDERFGGVNCRGLNGTFGYRQDMFLSMESETVQAGLKEAIQNLGPLLQGACSREGMLHEISSIVSDPKSPRQCIHADTIFLPSKQFPVPMKPLYTLFFALQDITDDMGHTTYLPRTHTERAHELWNTTPKQKEAFIAAQPAVISSLNKGDVAIFDSRLLHCGGANISNKRRVLFYFTVSEDQRWPLPNGLHGSNSVRSADRWQWRLCDLGL